MKAGSIAFWLLVGLYLAATFTQPQDPAALARYNLTPQQARLLGAAIAAPVIAIWWLAFYGFTRFRDYALMIKEAADGQAMLKLANGLGVLALSMPLQAVISAVLDRIAQAQPDMTAMTVIANNYIALGFSVAAFWLLWSGARNLSFVTRIEPTSTLRLGIALKIIALGAVYSYFVLTNAIRQVPAESGRALFYLSDPLIILTIILPTIFTWFAGCRAAAWVWVYSKRVPGILYRDALQYLSAGILAVVLSSVAIRILTAASGASLSALALGPIVALIYGLLLVVSIGFLLIAWGARKLQIIEQTV